MGCFLVKTLDIQTSRPVLDITSTRAQLNISNKIRRFKVRSTPPQMKVHRQAAQFKVDWNKVWAQSGRRSPEHLQNHMKQVSRQKVDQAISRIVSNGNYMKQLHKYIGTDTNPVAELALESMKSKSAPPELNVASMPESLPDISWDPGGIKIEWTTGEVQIDWDEDFRPDITVSPHSVEIRLSGKKEVKISVNPDKVDRRNINKKA